MSTETLSNVIASNNLSSLFAISIYLVSTLFVSYLILLSVSWYIEKHGTVGDWFTPFYWLTLKKGNAKEVSVSKIIISFTTCVVVTMMNVTGMSEILIQTIILGSSKIISTIINNIL